MQDGFNPGFAQYSVMDTDMMGEPAQQFTCSACCLVQYRYIYHRQYKSDLHCV
jgi:hypothetical protein